MRDLGNFASGSTLYYKFPTQKLDQTPITFVGGVVKVYRDDDTTTESTTGVTLTTDFDGITGHHCLKIVMSDAFYAVGHDYQAVITAGTVDSVSVVGKVLCSWSIENRITSALKAGVITETSIANGAITNAKVADDVDVNVKTISNNAITAAAINDGAITNAKVADDVDVNVKTVTTDAISAAAVSAAAVTKIQAGIATTGADGDTLETLSDQLDLIGATAGEVEWAYTVRVNGTPQAGALVKLYSDSGYTTFVQQGYTLASGVVTFHITSALNAATKYLKTYAPGWAVQYDAEVP